MPVRPATSCLSVPTSYSPFVLSTHRPATSSKRGITETAECRARSYGLEAKVDYRRSHDATINHSTEAAKIRAWVTRFAGAENVVEPA